MANPFIKKKNKKANPFSKNSSKNKKTNTPQVVASNKNGYVTLWCEAGKHEWERKSQRGRRPVNCPEHTVTIVPNTKRVRRGNDMRKAREAKERISEERKRELLAQNKAELKELKTLLPKYDKDYNKALNKATKAKKPEEVKILFDRADQLMNRVLSTSTRIRKLEQIVGQNGKGVNGKWEAQRKGSATPKKENAFLSGSKKMKKSTTRSKKVAQVKKRRAIGPARHTKKRK